MTATPLRPTSSTPPARTRVPTGWYSPADCSLDDFRSIVEGGLAETSLDDHPYADALEQGVLVYGSRLREHTTTAEGRRDVQAELARALADGPGIVVFKGAFDHDDVDRATGVFAAMIEEQRAAGTASGDHFAKPGANDRVWGALDKLAVRAPEVFARYYANDVLALVSEAWLGRGYQVTSQVNVVNPGGQAQTAHRDYHLGFMDQAQALGYPAQVHALSPVLTLQGAVAHVDMPVETGPTLYLPHSQKHPAGYIAFHRREFTQYFLEHSVQLPLAKGDAAFFNPALFHGAGTNRSTDVRRMANLLQVSSGFGRAMEDVDRVAASKALFGALSAQKAAGVDERSLRNVVAASAEGYAFPTNLDRDQPIDGLAPQTQAELVWQALSEGWDAARLEEALDAQAARRRSAV
ncbi:phytanoyl-CoA dioxygenase family protein [Quadrisphaera oryzae]|uniref:phytanoyl-CoA dioxygenase family protein n=1 Tax=Quadrisphaera TaxID=317661 RepID=UPI0016466142|nr:phytanoyl-CoA dioxygenase family protein [Quadrisphaera sp. RL12-1S]MBC3763847.1 phytanoyl-CoA dioxygenase family protein [Quadrisphaera sp. RL12-1S]